jgi:hypothetical protein
VKHLKLGTKILLGGLLALAIPVIIIGIVSVYESSRSISKMQKEDMISIAESLAGALGNGMAEQLMTVRNISYSNSVIAAAEKVAREGEKEQSERDCFCPERTHENERRRGGSFFKHHACWQKRDRFCIL